MGTIIGGKYVLSQTGDQADAGIARGLEYPAAAAGTEDQVPTKTEDSIEWATPAAGGVTSFNSRTGAVVSAVGDYTPDMVGAAPLDKAVEPDNWFFPSAAVINQRGVSGTIATPGYFIDRWKLASGNVQLASGGLVLNGAIQQIVDNAFPNIQTVTALATDGSLIDGTFDAQTNTVEFSASGKTIQAVDFSPLSYPIRFRKSGATWSQVVSAPNFQQELAKCQRHFLPVRQGRIMGTWAGSAFVIFVPTPVTLRINPIVDVKALGTLASPVNLHAVSSINNAGSVITNGVNIVGSTSDTAASNEFIICLADAQFDLSADL